MKYSAIDKNSPWWAAEETQALLAEIRERRARAADGAIGAIREGENSEANRQVGAVDAYGGLIFSLQPRGSDS